MVLVALVAMVLVVSEGLWPYFRIFVSVRLGP